MGIISMIIVGFIVGLLARAIMPGDQKLGIIMTVILGIIGAVVAGYLCGALGLYEPGEGAGWIGSIVGAMIVLFNYGLIVKKRLLPSRNHGRRRVRRLSFSASVGQFLFSQCGRQITTIAPHGAYLHQPLDHRDPPAARVIVGSARRQCGNRQGAGTGRRLH